MSDDMPAQPKTTELPAADKAAVQFNELKVLIMTTFSSLDAKVAKGFREQDAKFDVLFSWKEDVDASIKNNSMRAKAPSAIDLDIQAQLAVAVSAAAEEKAKREALEAKAVTKEDLAKTTAAQTTALVQELAKNPIVTKIVYSVGGAIVAYAASKGIHFL